MSAAVAVQVPALEAAASVAAQAANTAAQQLAQIRSVAIDSPESAAWAAKAAREIRESQKLCEAEKDRVCKPIRKVANDHSAAWKPAIDNMGLAIAHLKNGVAAYESRLLAEQSKALAQAANAGPAEVKAAAAAIVQPTTGLKTRTVWRYEVIDLHQVPTDYFVLDADRIARELKQHKGSLSIPGIKPIAEMTKTL